MQHCQRISGVPQCDVRVCNIVLWPTVITEPNFIFHLQKLSQIMQYGSRGHSGYGLSQWAEALLCNTFSRWLNPYTKHYLRSMHDVPWKQFLDEANQLIAALRLWQSRQWYIISWVTQIVLHCSLCIILLHAFTCFINGKISFGHHTVNSPWPGDAIWRHRSKSILVQVMACCLTAPSHCLHQCWLIVK